MALNEYGVLQPKTFAYKWEISNFYGETYRSGQFYTSPVFSIQCVDMVTKWYLKVYPRGKHEKSEDFVSLYLHYQNENTSEVIVDFRMSIVSKQNNLSRGSEARIWSGPTDNWGWSNFVEYDVLDDEANGALIDDVLIILCEISFPQIAQGITEAFQYYELSKKIGEGFEDYEKLLEDSYFSDVTFKIQDQKLHLHKAILMCRNPVFKAMFEHEMKEKKESVVEITDVDYEVMKELFRFIYSGKVQNIENIAKNLLIAADKYDVAQLKLLCERALYDNLNINNAIEYLNLTEICNTIHLKSLVIKFVAAHHKEIAKMLGFAELNSHLMHQIILSIGEED